MEVENVPLRTRRRSYAYSQQSISKYSERSLHSIPSTGSGCQECMSRIPYATLIASIMCLVGVGVFCGTMYRGATLSVLMLDQVFHLRVAWVEAVQLIFVVLGACMAGLGVVILFIGFLATGATRHQVYRAWGARVSGRVTCAVLLGITYILEIAWILMLICLVIVTLIFTVFWAMCNKTEVQNNIECIDLRSMNMFFPAGTRPEDMQVCGMPELKLFCKDYVEKAEVMFILASVACVLVILSLIHYLMCLAANYAHIRDHEKIQELNELQILNEEMSMHGSKDRF